MTTERFHRAYSTKQRMGTNGKLACLQCDGDIVDKRRSTFCSVKCADAFYLKTGRNVRELVFERDKGICGKCQADTMSGRPAYLRHSHGTGHLWQADHIVPVVEGGGVCTLENYRTLCTSCHKDETALLRKRMARARNPNHQVQVRALTETERQQRRLW